MTCHASSHCGSVRLPVQMTLGHIDRSDKSQILKRVSKNIYDKNTIDRNPLLEWNSDFF